MRDSVAGTGSVAVFGAQWQDEANAFGDRDLSGTDFVYLWVDSIHLKVPLGQSPKHTPGLVNRPWRTAGLSDEGG